MKQDTTSDIRHLDVSNTSDKHLGPSDQTSDIRHLTIDVNHPREIGPAILDATDEIPLDGLMQIRLLDGAELLGLVTIRNESSLENDCFDVRGSFYRGDRVIPLEFQTDGLNIISGPEPIIGNRQQMFADGTSWTRETAPRIKPYQESAGAKILRERAEHALSQWGKRKIGGVPNLKRLEASKASEASEE